ncbi:MAG: hypothetical protein JWQ96_2792 [Segetibacter sp.]|nr:hypothetical protein [Segetibacter sp.]
MSAPQKIQLLSNKSIDRKRWDYCVRNSTNSLIYAHSFYLDNICPQWTAIIGEDYSWVLPLTPRKKWGISYLYPPAFTQQLGIFTNDFKKVDYESIWLLIKKNYSFIATHWNYALPKETFAEDVTVKEATNLIVDLSSSYASIKQRYHNDLLKNLKKSEGFSLNYAATEDYQAAITNYIEHYGSRMPHVTFSDYEAFKNVCSIAYKRGMLLCRNVVNEQQETMAAALLLYDGRRLYNIMNTTTFKGRKAAANHFLIDNIFKEFAGQRNVFDFEGSDLEGVKPFYENFGAVNQPYYMLGYNKLPWPISLLKR